MLEEYGKAMRNFRENRGFSLRMLAEGIVDPSTLAKYERGTTGLSFESLIPLLARLHITIGEFLYRARSFEQDPKAAFFSQVTRAYLDEDIDMLHILNEQATSKLATAPNRLPYDRLDLITIRAATAMLQDTQLDANDATFASAYFLENQDWYYYDLQSLRFICIFFSLEDLLAISRMLFTSVNTYSRVGNSMQYVNEIALEIIDGLISYGDLDNARKTIADFDKQPTIINSIMASLNLKELSAALKYLDGQEVSATTEFQKVIDTLRWLSFNQQAKQLTDQWNRLTKKS